MKIGNLRHRVEIQKVTTQGDNMGGYSETWEKFAEAWANIEPTRGNERYVAQQTVGELTHKVVIRYLSGVTPGMRIVYGNRYLSIVSVSDLGEEHRWLELVCKETL